MKDGVDDGFDMRVGVATRAVACGKRRLHSSWKNVLIGILQAYPSSAFRGTLDAEDETQHEPLWKWKLRMTCLQNLNGRRSAARGAGKAIALIIWSCCRANYDVPLAPCTEPATCPGAMTVHRSHCVKFAVARNARK